jgi:hypothetical protein
MKFEFARRSSLKIVALCAVASVLPTASIAAPVRHQTKGNGPHACSCMCDVVLGGQQTYVPTNFSLPAQYNCASAAGGVCNVSDPTTGGIRSGTLKVCGDGTLHATVPPSVLKPPVTNPIGNAPTR